MRQPYRAQGKLRDSTARVDDPRSLDDIDDRFAYGEDRFNITGMAGGRPLTVSYTERNGRFRIISARKETRHEHDDRFSQAF